MKNKNNNKKYHFFLENPRSMDASPGFSISYFPSEILLQIFSYLTVDELIPLSAVSKRWKSLVDGPYLWKQYQNQSNDEPKVTNYRTKYIADEKLKNDQNRRKLINNLLETNRDQNFNMILLGREDSIKNEILKETLFTEVSNGKNNFKIYKSLCDKNTPSLQNIAILPTEVDVILACVNEPKQIEGYLRLANRYKISLMFFLTDSKSITNNIENAIYWRRTDSLATICNKMMEKIAKIENQMTSKRMPK